MLHHAPSEEEDEWDSRAHAPRQFDRHLHVIYRIFDEYSLYMVNYTFSPQSFIKLQISPWTLENYILALEVS